MRTIILSLFIGLASASLIFCAGCKKESTVAPSLSSYDNSSSGESIVTNEHIIIVRNPLGTVIMNGEGSANPSIRWSVYKTVQAESRTQASDLFASIALNLQTSNDTIYVTLNSSRHDNSSLQGSVQIGIPYNMICRIEQVAGNTYVSDLDTSLFVENASNVNVERHNGSCDISSGVGNVSVEFALPTNGLCRVNVTKGDITLKAPTTTSATVYAKSNNGTVSLTGFIITITQQQSNFLTGTLGSGSGEIHAETNQGTIRLQSL
jgi:DUF4097 and DUF4098 domain-containing protein YvlB